ncbi:MAG TPA: 4-carboxy-4-hydroxy-2-oxoadipate aldolase/oxaloacetate decarboxylase [Thermodesulfobacteriota bacterium]|nr:4-carboxy-4-hydroxy-2-oxoadipate aldolase/oxaloacetate decarboxylase [Thermodesulfobacteriota bacterium]
MGASDAGTPGIEPSLLDRAARFSAATLHEAMGRRGALPAAIKPLDPRMRLLGPALPVSAPPFDNLTLHQAIYAARPGDVLVVEVAGAYEAGYWGEIMTCAARPRGVAGLVIDGCVRDGALIAEMGFPVFARGLAIRGTAKAGGGRIGEPIAIGGVVVAAGDLVVGDGDGVVVVPRAELARVLDEADRREEKERRVKAALAAGRTTLDIYGWR